MSITLFISLFNFLENNSGVTKASSNYIKQSNIIDYVLLPYNNNTKNKLKNKKIIFFKKNVFFRNWIIPNLFHYIYKYRPNKIILEGNISVIYLLVLTVQIKIFTNVKIIYLHMHNIDYDIRYNRNLLIKIATFISEYLLYRLVSKVSMVTINDCNRVKKLYNVNSIHIPNKIDLTKIIISSNVFNEKYVTFLGSYEYTPNRIAINFIIEKLLPICINMNVKIIHCGGGRLPECKYSDVFISLGSVANYQLYSLLSKSMCNLVPVKYGAGSKIKLLESILSGVPTLAFSESVRGLSFLFSGNPVIANDNFEDEFIKILKYNDEYKREAVKLAYVYEKIYKEYNTADFE